jgi:hypothetical protein
VGLRDCFGRRHPIDRKSETLRTYLEPTFPIRLESRTQARGPNQLGKRSVEAYKDDGSRNLEVSNDNVSITVYNPESAVQFYRRPRGRSVGEKLSNRSCSM